MGGVLLVAGFAIGTAQAAMITYELDVEFSGADEPFGTAPWLRATFDDSVGTDTVRLTMESLLQDADEFVGGNINEQMPSSSQFGWGFNFNPNKTLNDLSFSLVSGNQATGISLSPNAFKADGDGHYDILFAWSDSSDRFSGSDTAVYDITGITGLGAGDFDFLSVDSSNGTTFHTAAHVQGIGSNANGSGWIGDTEPGSVPPAQVPEPGTLFMLGTGLLGLGLARLWRKGYPTLVRGY